MPELVPALQARLHLLDDVAPMTGGPPSPEDLARFEQFGAPADGYVPPEVVTSEAEAPGPHGPVPVRVYASAEDSPAVRGLVWVHGGGFLAGHLDMPEADVVARELVARGGTVVVSVDYRLCRDGVHFPVPHDDVHAAYVWARESSGLLAEGGWSVGGASAGGNLAAGAAQRLRDEGTPPECVVLAYPVLHDPIPAASPRLQDLVAGLPLVLRFPPAAAAAMNGNYLGPSGSDTPYAFPGHGELTGSPRTLVIGCEFDDLLPSAVQYAADLAAAGSSVELVEVDGVVHGHLNIAGLAEAVHTIDTIAAFLAAGTREE